MTTVTAIASALRSSTSWRWPLALLVLLVVIALLAPVLAPFPYDQPSLDEGMANRAPSATHPFGTDAVGRDVLSRVLFGSRVSLLLSFASVTLALVLGTCYGAWAGLRGGATDRWLMRALDVALSIPRLLLLFAVAAFWPKLSLVGLVVLLGCTGWFEMARLVRGEVVALRDRDYMMAAVATGVPQRRVFARHVLPHLIPLLAVTATLNVSSTIALEAGLSFLGLGVQPPKASWGTIIADGKDAIGALWWLTVFPGIAMIMAVFASHALGDALRELLAVDQVPA